MSIKNKIGLIMVLTPPVIALVACIIKAIAEAPTIGAIIVISLISMVSGIFLIEPYNLE